MKEETRSSAVERGVSAASKGRAGRRGLRFEKDAVFPGSACAPCSSPTEGTRRVADIAAQPDGDVATAAVERVAGRLHPRHRRGKACAPPARTRQDQPDAGARGGSRELAAGLRAGRWRTGAQMAAWLKQTHAITLCKTQWVLLAWKRQRGVVKVPRPVHTRKAAVVAAAEFPSASVRKARRLQRTSRAGSRSGSKMKRGIGLHDPLRPGCWGRAGRAGGW